MQLNHRWDAETYFVDTEGFVQVVWGQFWSLGWLWRLKVVHNALQGILLRRLFGCWSSALDDQHSAHKYYLQDGLTDGELECGTAVGWRRSDSATGRSLRWGGGPSLLALLLLGSPSSLESKRRCTHKHSEFDDWAGSLGIGCIANESVHAAIFG